MELRDATVFVAAANRGSVLQKIKQLFEIPGHNAIYTDLNVFQ